MAGHSKPAVAENSSEGIVRLVDIARFSTAIIESEKFKNGTLYETLTVKEEITDYLKTGTRFSAPSQVYDTFSFLMKKTKEMFLTLHLDGKNRIMAMDMVSIGSLNQSIVHPREVSKTACLSNAAALILIHQLCGAPHKLCNVQLCGKVFSVVGGRQQAVTARFSSLVSVGTIRNT